MSEEKGAKFCKLFSFFPSALLAAAIKEERLECADTASRAFYVPINYSLLFAFSHRER